MVYTLIKAVSYTFNAVRPLPIPPLPPPPSSWTWRSAAFFSGHFSLALKYAILFSLL